ncbi:MAG: toll/interleukin-1 receptor domain-containing protein [Acidobacteriota bacterium]
MRDVVINARTIKTVVNAEAVTITDARVADQASRLREGVFVSYSHEDSSFAFRLQDELTRRSIRSWIDRSMRIGDQIADAVHDELRKSARVIVCWSQHAAASEWVKRELGITLAAERAETIHLLIPVDLDGSLLADPQTDLTRELRARLTAQCVGWEQDDAIFERELQRIALACLGK